MQYCSSQQIFAEVFNKMFMQYSILIGPDWLFLWRPVYIQEDLKLLHKNIKKHKKGSAAILSVKQAWCHGNVIMSCHFKDAVLYKVVKV